MKNIVILISGRGSNMEAIVGARLPAKVAAVISNRADAAGLKFAAQSGIAAQVVDEREFSSRGTFDAALEAAIERHSPDLLALAGFMRVLGGDFVRHYSGRMVNIHPSLLPAFPGLHTHRRALQEGVKLHGCTVHFVTPQVDHGPIIVQAAVPVRAGDTEATLAARVLRQEHRVYPLAIRWFVEGRLAVENGIVRVNASGAVQAVLADE
ncbi:MAG TPA: phosphoribosylglycinamide formyltransferase [Burkholderiales bacterium]|nr:phosphoribosylglycinamide formyltransferase [Burkholderiales bacterium]